MGNLKRISLLAGAGIVVLAVAWPRPDPGRTIVVEKLSPREENELWSGNRAPAVASWHKRYRFRRELSAKTPVRSILKFDLRGTLDLTRDGDWVRASFQLDRSAQHAGSRSSIPFYFSLNARGEITEIRSSGDADQQSILKDLALLFAYRTPSDPAGEVESEIRDSTSEFIKRKVRYRGDVGALIRIAKSEHRIRKDLTLLAGAEVTHLGEIETESKYQLKLVSSDLTAGEGVNPRMALQFPVLPLFGGDVVSPERPALSWKTLKLELARVSKSPSARRMKLFHEMIRTLRKDPQALQEFKEWMSLRRKAGEDGHRDFLFGVGVLSGVGSPGAQTALLQAYRDAADPAILNSLATMTAPATAETREQLRALARSKEESESIPALLALGSSLRPRDGVADDEAAIALLLARYRDAASIGEKLELLDAMGNSGNARFLPTLFGVIESRDAAPALISKAIYALRFMKAEEARAALRRLASDRSYASYQRVIASAQR